MCWTHTEKTKKGNLFLFISNTLFSDIIFFFSPKQNIIRKEFIALISDLILQRTSEIKSRVLWNSSGATNWLCLWWHLILRKKQQPRQISLMDPQMVWESGKKQLLASIKKRMRRWGERGMIVIYSICKFPVISFICSFLPLKSSNSSNHNKNPC